MSDFEQVSHSQVDRAKTELFFPHSQSGPSLVFPMSIRCVFWGAQPPPSNQAKNLRVTLDFFLSLLTQSLTSSNMSPSLPFLPFFICEYFLIKGLPLSECTPNSKSRYIIHFNQLNLGLLNEL